MENKYLLSHVAASRVVRTRCYIEASLPKQQLVECTTLWCNSVAKHLRRRRSRLLLHHCLVSPAHWFTHSVYERSERTDLHRNQTIKMAPNTTRQCAVPSCGKSLSIAFLLIPTLGKSGWTLFLVKIQTASVRARSFVHFILPQILLQTRHNSMQDFQKDWNWKTMLCWLYWIRQ